MQTEKIKQLFRDLRLDFGQNSSEHMVRDGLPQGNSRGSSYFNEAWRSIESQRCSR
jgi:hypothetical protein